jgi:hypothetical protein
MAIDWPTERPQNLLRCKSWRHRLGRSKSSISRQVCQKDNDVESFNGPNPTPPLLRVQSPELSWDPSRYSMLAVAGSEGVLFGSPRVSGHGTRRQAEMDV